MERVFWRVVEGFFSGGKGVNVMRVELSGLFEACRLPFPASSFFRRTQMCRYVRWGRFEEWWGRGDLCFSGGGGLWYR